MTFFEESVTRNWDLPALSDYNGSTYTYGDLALQIEKFHIFFEAAGIQKGDRVALCAKNSANWAAAFWSIITYGAVAVPILNDFTPEIIYNILKHSNTRMFFMGDGIKVETGHEVLAGMAAVMRVEDFTVHSATVIGLEMVLDRMDALIEEKYPDGFGPSDVHYERFDPEQTALINYTSGSTGQPKGVVLPYRSLCANVSFAFSVLGENRGSNVLSVLPMAHMYGLAFEFIFETCSGMHVFFLGKVPSPKVISEAFLKVRPKVIIFVPLILEKIVRKQIFPVIDRPLFRFLFRVPLVSGILKKKVCKKLVDAFGGEFVEIIIGGAGLNKEVEDFLSFIHFPYMVGYGMTECAPIIAYEHWDRFKKGSCGKAAKGMVLKIDSEDPENIVGEILTKGDCLMSGYYKNEEATAEAIDADGWLHTGDLGVIDREGNLFIRGRKKNMILGPSGQNIYPEEIESMLNNLEDVSENVVIEREGKITALIYPDPDRVETFGLEQIQENIRKSITDLNVQLPAFSKIATIEFREEEFEKTPKKSIKRFLYK